MYFFQQDVCLSRLYNNNKIEGHPSCLIHATDSNHVYHSLSNLVLFCFFERKRETMFRHTLSVCKYECICVYTDVFNHTFLSREIKSHISKTISELRQQLSLVFMSDRCDNKGVCILSTAVDHVFCFCFRSSYEIHPIKSDDICLCPSR